GVDLMLQQANAAAQERASQQYSLFGFGQQEMQAAFTLPPVEGWGPVEKLRHEFEALGFFMSAHPLQIYGRSLERMGVRSSTSLASQKDGAIVKVAGVLLVKQERTSKVGQKFAFIQVSDLDGIFEVAVFSEVFSRTRDLLIPGHPLLMTVIARFDEER